MRALVLPILVPLSTAALLMLAPRRPDAQRWISLTGSIVLLACACGGGSSKTTRTTPSPSHASQRPPGTLNEKWLGERPRVLASLVAANRSRIASNALR